MGEKNRKSEGLTPSSSPPLELTALQHRLEELELRLTQEIAERERAEEEATRRAAQAKLIHEVGKRVSSELELDELFSAIVTDISDAFGYYSVILATVDESSSYLTIGAITGGFADIFPRDKKIALGEGMTGYAAQIGETQISGDVSQDPHFLRLEDEETRSELVVPLKSGENVIGVLDLQSVDYDAFHQTDIMVMETLADQVVVAIKNARLYEQAQKEIAERKRVEMELRQHQENLEVRVEERTIELKESEERYRTLFDGIPVGLYRTTPSGQVLDANLALAEMYGYTNRDTLLNTDITYAYVEPDERVRWQVLMAEQGVVRDFEVRIQCYDGREIWVNDTARAVRDAKGQVLYYEGSVEDITERKQAEDKLLQYQEHLEELVDERTAELQASEERYRTLFDGVPIGLYRTTPDGQVLDANLASVQMMGYPSREYILNLVNNTQVYANPDDRGLWQQLMEKEGIVRNFEVQIRRYDGEIVWISDTARAVKDEAGNTLYYEGSLEDITEQKEFEEEIRRQKDYFEALFINSPVAIVTADNDSRVVSWNPRAEKLFGYRQEEAVGRVIDDLVANDPNILDEAKKFTEEIMRKGRAQATTKRTRRDGSLVDVEFLALPLVLAGEQVGFYALYHDISELKRVERELRHQKDYFESLFVNNPVAVVTADLETKVVSWNPMAEKMFGYSQDEAIGIHIDDLVATDPRIRAEAQAYTQELLTTDRMQATVKRNRKDGSLVDVEALVLPSIVAGEKVGYIGIYFDISELLQARREAETANRAKSIFLANMSHELRTPLNAILGFTQLMVGDANLTPGQQENLQIINQSGEHLLILINDVLEISKIEAGQVKLRENTFDLYQLLDGLEEIFHFQAEKKGLDLLVQFFERLPHHIRCDEGKLRQILNNLIGNAIKFTQQGFVKIDVTGSHQPTGKYELVFEVCDTGPGISPEDLEVVFDPFVQAAHPVDMTSTQVSEGTGLGLSISRNFARLMGGDITASSKVGSGSIFRVTLMVEVVTEDAYIETQPQQEVLGLASGEPAYRLLVVEDQETNRRLLVKLLEQVGFEVKEASNGLEAVEIWQQWNPHLIWMDMRMPVLNGQEATRRIKSMPGGQSVVIIALTATAFDEEREQILQDGCDDFVRKPFRKNEIFDLLTKHLDVGFIYREETESATKPDAAEALLPATRVAEISIKYPEWEDAIRQACLQADIYRILGLIDQIRDLAPDLATGLGSLAEKYEYQRMLTLLDDAGVAK